jgi:hypothetical protein
MSSRGVRETRIAVFACPNSVVLRVSSTIANSFQHKCRNMSSGLEGVLAFSRGADCWKECRDSMAMSWWACLIWVAPNWASQDIPRAKTESEVRIYRLSRLWTELYLRLNWIKLRANLSSQSEPEPDSGPKAVVSVAWFGSTQLELSDKGQRMPSETEPGSGQPNQ